MVNSWNPAIISEDIEKLKIANKANNTFSSDESPTGEFWIDGKPIYRKVIITTLPADITDGTYKTYSVNVTGIDTLLEMSGIITSGVSRYEVPYVSATGYFAKVQYNTSTEKLVVAANGNSFSENPIEIILKYTKGTSQAKNGDDETRNIEDPEADPVEKQEEK